jgi:hypothetical protein
MPSASVSSLKLTQVIEISVLASPLPPRGEVDARSAAGEGAGASR